MLYGFVADFRAMLWRKRSIRHGWRAYAAGALITAALMMTAFVAVLLGV